MHGPSWAEDGALRHDAEPATGELLNCPACARPSEVLNTFSLPSTDGLVEHVEISCVSRHRFMMPAY